MRELIGELRRLYEGGAFGSIEWQDEQIANIKNKLKNKEPLSVTDRAFIEIQLEHNKRLMDELKSLGYDEGRFNVN